MFYKNPLSISFIHRGHLWLIIFSARAPNAALKSYYYTCALNQFYSLCTMQALTCIPYCIWSFDKLNTASVKNDHLQYYSLWYCQVSTNLNVPCNHFAGVGEWGEGRGGVAKITYIYRLHLKSWNIYKTLFFIHITMYVRCHNNYTCYFDQLVFGPVYLTRRLFLLYLSIFLHSIPLYFRSYLYKIHV